MYNTIILRAEAANGMLPQLLVMGAIGIVFYFFMIRPQVKKAKDHKKLVSELKKGDKIITTAGIHGIIREQNDTTFLIEVEGGTKIRFEKSAISLDATKATMPKA